nr:MAG: hypothetical protein [Microviridae sp.]
MLYDIRPRGESQIEGREMYTGETIEEKIRRIMEDKEPVDNEGVQLVYSARADGVLPETNIRTDRWDLATEAMDIASKAKKAQRDDKEAKEKLAKEAKEGMKKEGTIDPPPILN